MKKSILIGVMALAAANASAYDYPFMLFTAADGSQKTIRTENLSIRIADGKIVADNGTENLSLDLLSCSKMKFATDTQGVGLTGADAASEPVEVYTLAGVHAGTFDSIEKASASLSAGIYLVNQGSETRKIIVK